MNGFPRRLVLIQRQKTIRIWPTRKIALQVLSTAGCSLVLDSPGEVRCQFLSSRRKLPRKKFNNSSNFIWGALKLHNEVFILHVRLTGFSVLVPPSDSHMILLAAFSLCILLLLIDSNSRSLFSFSRSVHKQDIPVVKNLLSYMFTKLATLSGCEAEWAIDPWPLRAKGLIVLVSPN